MSSEIQAVLRPETQTTARLPWSLTGAMVVQFAAGGAVIPFITLLLRDRGLAFDQISVIILAASATLLIFPFLWGMLADRFVPLNRLFLIMNLLAAGALSVFGFQTKFPGLLVAFTSFFACFSPTLTLVHALSFHHLPRPREQFGRLRAWGSLGWILPFLPISLWLAVRQRMELDFIVYLCVGLCLSMAALSFWLPYTPPRARGTRPGERSGGSYLPAMRRLLKNPNYLVIILSMFVVSGSYSILMYYSPPYLEDIGVPRPWIGPVQSIGVIFEIVLFRWQALLIRRWNYRSVLLAGCLALLVRQLLFAVSANPWLLSLSYLLAGAVIVLFHMGISVLANTIATPEVRSSAQSVLVFVAQGIGPLFANWVVGGLTARSGGNLRPVFLFAAGLSAIAVILIALRGQHLNRAGGVGLKPPPNNSPRQRIALLLRLMLPR